MISYTTTERGTTVNCIKTKYRQETEKEIEKALGISIDELYALLDIAYKDIKKEKSDAMYAFTHCNDFDTQIEKGTEVMPW